MDAMMTAQHRKRVERLQALVGLVLCAIVLPLIVAIVLPVVLAYLVWAIILYVAVWCCWCARGRNILLVYSNSPIWKDRVEQHILPRIEDHAVVVNWSERARWRRTLAVHAFRHFGGSREFNPMAIVFRPFRLARTFRFYEPFREFKHGKPEAVAKMESDLFEVVEQISGTRAAL
jgi:hypothetical protein